MLETAFENEKRGEPAEFRLVSPFAPMGDQPEAIDALVAGFEHSA